MTRQLKYKCPDCGATLRPIEGMNTATQAVNRKCQHCKTSWRVVVTPQLRSIGWFDTGAFSKIEKTKGVLKNDN